MPKKESLVPLSSFNIFSSSKCEILGWGTDLSKRAVQAELKKQELTPGLSVMQPN